MTTVVSEFEMKSITRDIVIFVFFNVASIIIVYWPGFGENFGRQITVFSSFLIPRVASEVQILADFGMPRETILGYCLANLMIFPCLIYLAESDYWRVRKLSGPQLIVIASSFNARSTFTRFLIVIASLSIFLFWDGLLFPNEGRGISRMLLTSYAFMFIPALYGAVLAEAVRRTILTCFSLTKLKKPDSI